MWPHGVKLQEFKEPLALVTFSFWSSFTVRDTEKQPSNSLLAPRGWNKCQTLSLPGVNIKSSWSEGNARAGATCAPECLCLASVLIVNSAALISWISSRWPSAALFSFLHLSMWKLRTSASSSLSCRNCAFKWFCFLSQRAAAGSCPLGARKLILLPQHVCRGVCVSEKNFWGDF